MFVHTPMHRLVASSELSELKQTKKNLWNWEEKVEGGMGGDGGKGMEMDLTKTYIWVWNSQKIKIYKDFGLAIVKAETCRTF